jgi:hypothetical protein
MNRYHKKILSSWSAENIIGLFSRYRGGPKEITESFGMFEAAKKVCDNIDECKIVVIGDGCTPRTGIVFAYFSKADVISIDPNFNMDHWEQHYEKQKRMEFEPKRIKLIKDKIENIKIDCEFKKTILLWPHSHADMRNIRLKNKKIVIDIAMPCCVPIPSDYMKIPHLTYDDYDILSPKRTIHIWENIR